MFSVQKDDQFQEHKMVGAQGKELVHVENEDLCRSWPYKVFSHV